MTQLKTEQIGVPTTLQQEIREELDCAVRSDAKVLITGQDRLKREAIARIIHQYGARGEGQFLSLNCSASELSVQCELFGDRGLLIQALNGTLFIDNIGEMSPHMQDELVRFLDAGTEVRIIAGTNRNLYEDVLAGRFREHLYYRLNIIHIVCPRSETLPHDVPAKNRRSLIATERRALGKAV